MSLTRTSGEPEPVAPGTPGSTKSGLLHPAMSSSVERAWGDRAMDIVYPCCAGLDVHKKAVVACIRRLGPFGQPDEQVRTFGTMTGDLLELADWLAAQGVVQVAMESTGVSWEPLLYLLEELFPVMLVNARHIKQAPGRKTDVKDCQWIAQLLQHGLLHPGFVPPAEIRECAT